MAAGVDRPRARIFKHLYVQVLIAILLGALIGHLWPAGGTALKILGDAFIRLVQMIVTPVIFLTVVSGVAGMRELGQFGRVAVKALAYFLFFSTLALILGLIVANVVQPGGGMNIDARTLDAAAVASYAQKAHEASLGGFLLQIIPDTAFSSLTSGSILQTLLVAVLFGVALSLTGTVAEPLVDLLERLATVMFRMVRMLMRTAPLGAFGAIAFTVSKYGIGSLAHLGGLVATFYLTSFLFVAVILGLVGRLVGFSVFSLIRYLKTELLLVFGTSSSEPALPSLMEKLEQAGCAKPIVGLVVPTGYSFNLDGTNIYMTLSALFVAQATNVHIPLGGQITLLLVAMVSSKGAAGVTGAGFITLAATLSVVPSIPVAGMALILGIDRFMSECRSVTNLIGNAVATIVIAAWERGLDREKLDRALAAPRSDQAGGATR